MTSWKPDGRYCHLPKRDDGTLLRDPLVPEALYELLTEAVDADWAGSRLMFARVVGQSVTPHTLTGYLEIARHKKAREALENGGWRLLRPLRYGHPDRADSKPVNA